MTEIDPPKPTLEEIVSAEKARRGRFDPADMNDPRARLGKRLGRIRSRMERNAALRGEPLEPLAPDLHEKIERRIRELLERSHNG
jgi:hypothetical protein